MSETPASARVSITDSPWYWVYLFCTAGLVALVLAAPKFAARQAQIERNYEARQRAAHFVAGKTVPATVDSVQEQSTRVVLWPLYLLLGCLLAAAWWNLGRRRYGARHDSGDQQPSGEARS